MDGLGTRRRFLGWANGALGAFGLAGHPLNAANRVADGEDYYDKLGVAKIINAAGTYTALTASTMPPSVQAAVARAAKHPVRLIELQKNGGEYLAQKLKWDAVFVPSA